MDCEDKILKNYLKRAIIQFKVINNELAVIKFDKGYVAYALFLLLKCFQKK